jgi:hypothetical protein
MDGGNVYHGQQPKECFIKIKNKALATAGGCFTVPEWRLNN